ncbi:hypothetical protein GRF29_213g51122 [Pseudopithomyces chartarum]|uniref:Phytanoyl-CoA dioxygenase n=1 Tax=Pseudopithomyces chartarum TaxID=1892770 RepID=A0AAN6LPP3_9PLEO|nr:hypothetical protein GRF29_213g51122 [Pseudopithomyces chartarum]
MESTTSTPTPIPSRLFSTANSSSLSVFKTLITNPPSTHYPLATETTSNIPIYTLPPFSSFSPSQRSALQDEWHHILLSGPGIFITKNLYPDPSLLTHVNEVFDSIIASEAAANVSKGDHFAPPNANTRIWNAFSKHGLRDPSSFVDYYSNPWIPLIASAWLGPAHRLTAQVNIVMPGGEAQIPHRDYHLGFQGSSEAAAFPRAAHAASQFLTLQGAVAHGDIPVESGPTRVLPYSQLVEGGYLSIRSEDFRALFQEHYVSLAMQQGDEYIASRCESLADIECVWETDGECGYGGVDWGDVGGFEGQVWEGGGE